MKTTKNVQAQTRRTELPKVPLTDEERKLVTRINMPDSAAGPARPKFIRQLLATPLIYW
jgi:hypothetical protein